MSNMLQLLVLDAPKGANGFLYWPGQDFHVGFNTNSLLYTRICRHVPKGKTKIISPNCRSNQKSFGLGFGHSRIRASAVHL